MADEVIVITPSDDSAEESLDASEVAEIVAETSSEVAEIVAEAIAAESETADVAIDHETIRLIVRDEIKALGLEERLDRAHERVTAVELADTEKAIAQAEEEVAEVEVVEALEELVEEVEPDEVRNGHWLYAERGGRFKSWLFGGGTNG